MHAIDETIGVAQRRHRPGEGFKERLQIRETAPVRVLARRFQPSVNGHTIPYLLPRTANRELSLECESTADDYGYCEESVIDRLAQMVPRELDRELDTERARAEPATPFREDTIAVAQVALDPPDTASGECVAPESPAR